MSTNCFFCNQQVTTNGVSGRDATEYVCNNCGKYIITGPFHESLKDIRPEDKARIAAVLYERADKSQSIMISDTKYPKLPWPCFTIQELLAQFPERVDEKLNRSLLNLGKLTEYLGQAISLNSMDFSIFYAINWDEMLAIIDELEQGGYIRKERYVTGDNPIPPIKLTAKGYERIYELGKVNPDSLQGFVAMWFPKPVEEKTEHDALNKAYDEGFKKAIKEAGYDDRRIDRKEFLGKIDDEIIAEIKRSRFLVADFTGQRGGVYYEAGFAHGLNIPVIYTCRQGDIDKCHFDTRQYNHIVWKDEADLYSQLLNRIRATIGQGPQAK